jgi:uncharacterized protein (TIGR02217 family)
VRSLIAFFRARRGPARGFRFRDPIDHSSAGDGGAPAATDQPIGVGDGATRDFALIKSYGEPAVGGVQQRPIRLPDAASLLVAIDGVANGGWTLQPGGVLRFAVPPPTGAAISAGFLFDVAVRFADDQLDVSRATFMAGEIATVPLIEVRGV